MPVSETQFLQLFPRKYFPSANFYKPEDQFAPRIYISAEAIQKIHDATHGPDLAYKPSMLEGTYETKLPGIASASRYPTTGLIVYTHSVPAVDGSMMIIIDDTKNKQRLKLFTKCGETNFGARTVQLHPAPTTEDCHRCVDSKIAKESIRETPDEKRVYITCREQLFKLFCATLMRHEEGNAEDFDDLTFKIATASKPTKAKFATLSQKAFDPIAWDSHSFFAMYTSLVISGKNPENFECMQEYVCRLSEGGYEYKVAEAMPDIIWGIGMTAVEMAELLIADELTDGLFAAFKKHSKGNNKLGVALTTMYHAIHGWTYGEYMNVVAGVSFVESDLPEDPEIKAKNAARTARREAMHRNALDYDSSASAAFLKASFLKATQDTPMPETSIAMASISDATVSPPITCGAVVAAGADDATVPPPGADDASVTEDDDNDDEGGTKYARTGSCDSPTPPRTKAQAARTKAGRTKAGRPETDRYKSSRIALPCVTLPKSAYQNAPAGAKAVRFESNCRTESSMDAREPSE